jgi:NADPH:quinone reductase-like Zn-dependent oxidoreductase
MQNIRDSLSKMAAGMDPIIDSEFALTDFEQGLKRLESRQVFGKVIVNF